MVHLVLELVRIGARLDSIDAAVNPERARALLKRRKEIERALERAKRRSQIHQPRYRDTHRHQPRPN